MAMGHTFPKGLSMKKLLGFTLAIASFASLHAQTTTILRPAIAFVKTPRDTLFIKQPDSAVQAYDLASMITTLTGNFPKVDSIRQLAVIGMTPAGDRIVLGCTMYYYDNTIGTHVHFQGLISLPWPLTANSLGNSSTGLQMMQSTRVFGPTPSTFRPIGILSKDGKQWWATLTSETDGNDSLTFYHGNTSGSGPIDSTTWNVQIVDGFHMSNIALDTKSNTMLAVSCNGVTSPDQETDLHPVFYAWNAGNGNDVSSTDFQGSLQGPPFANATSKNIDSLFGLVVIANNDAATALIGMTPTADNSINLYSVPDFASSFDLSTQAGQIPRSAITDPDEDFFAGRDCDGIYEEDPSGAEHGQPGNGGDMFVNSIGGDSIVFVTHESPYDCANRKVKSAIWMYDRSSGNSQMLYDDSNAQELQPVWIVMPYTIPAPINYPGIAWQTSYTGSFGTVDTAKTSPLTFTISDTSKDTTTVDSATITGTNASQFTLSGTNFPFTLAPGATHSYTVTFAPIAPAGLRSATLTVYFEGQSPSTITQSLTGTAHIPANGVKEDAALAATMSIQPNPFSSSAFVQLTAPDAGALGIQVRDALGRMVYTSDLRETGAGETESFEFDAKSLGLPDGVYYVTAFLGERQASRAVVFVH
jgi:hypothetical protein